MKINLIDVFYIDDITQQFKVRAINLYPYLLHAVDVYVTCENTEKYKWLMEPSETIDMNTGTKNNVQKMSISIDGNIFDIADGQQGSSPFNPIVYEKNVYGIQLTGASGTIGYIGTPPDSEYSVDPLMLSEDIGERNIGTNMLSSDDTLRIDVIINDKSLLVSEKFPWGGSKIVDGQVSESYDGFGGATNDNGLITPVEGYGGVPPNKYLEDIIIIIEPSKYLTELHTRDQAPGVQEYGIRY